MKLFLSFILSLCSVLGFSQTILNQPETTTRTVQDPRAVMLARGFIAKSGTSNPFIAKLGPATENPGGGPTDSNAGANNPSGTSAPAGQSFHDTKGNIEVNGSGQLQFTLPIALPPGVKNVAPQVNLVYTSGSGNGIAGYGWNLSGITAISRIGKTIEKDGEVKGVQLDYSDYYSFNGQRLILKSGEYGKDAEYVTEKYSNIKIKSSGIGPLSNPAQFEVTFEDGSQAWYGAYKSGFRDNPEVTTPLEYNIVKWRDAQGNVIHYSYRQQNNVVVLTSITWGGNEVLNKPDFNEILFTYTARDLVEKSYVSGIAFTQDNLLKEIKVNSNSQPFRSYGISYKKDNNGTQYQFLDKIIEYNSKGEAANPVTFDYETSTRATDWTESKSYSLETGLLGDFDGDGKIDALEYRDQPYRICESFTPGFNGTCVNPTYKPAGLYLVKKALDQAQGELIHVGTLDISKEEFQKALPVSYKNSLGIVENKQGFAFYKVMNNTKDIQLFVYSVNGNDQLEYQYTKTMPNTVYDLTTPEIGALDEGTSTKTTPLKFIEMDFDGDGLSELLLGFNDAVHTKVRKPQDPGAPVSLPEFDETFQNRKRYMIINMDREISASQSYSQMSFYPYDTEIFDIYKIGDFDGDGKTDFLRFDSGNRPFIIQFKKEQNNLYSAIERGFYLNDERVKGITKGAVIGDFNGDGRSDMLIPFSGTTTDWYLYQSTGKSFVEELKTNFSSYLQEPSVNANDDGTATIERTSHQAYDLNKDGKSDFVTFKYRKERVKVSNSLTLFSIYYYNTVAVKVSSGLNRFNNDIQYAFNEGPLNDSNGFINNSNTKLNERTKYDFQELLGNFRINQSVHQIILVAPQAERSVPGDRVKKIDFYDISKEARINSINQGGIKTTVSYKELDSNIAPGFYGSIKKEQYPYMELEKIPQTYAVSQLEQAGRKQDFRYRGMLLHFLGRGMLGFRQSARSSWYADGFENTKIWDGVEIDPLFEGMPVKEWSIKTNDESKIFPTDISENNTQLINFKSTIYQKDQLINGQVAASVTDVDKAKIVTVVVPKNTKTKDFLTNTVTESNVTYGEFYLPAKSITAVNTNYAVTISTFEYIHNRSGVGANYYVGRPKLKSDVVQAYGDTKSAKEEYVYENNLLSTVKKWNRDNSGWLQEAYTYDGYGNMLQKVINNSLDAQTRVTKTQYDDKGRFVIKKTDNLGLNIQIAYNDWGQITRQIDPLGNTLDNTYDNWGKLLTSKTNLGGITTYQYEKDNNANIIITQNDPDGDVSKKYTNKLGQEYKTSSKALGQGQYVSKEIQYDVLGRKVKESEPYFEGQTAGQWNILTYNDSVFPTIITATASNGKQLETSVSGFTTTIKELNGYGRTTTKTSDALGNTVSTTDKGGTITFSYNAAGEQIKAQYAENIVTTKYDEWGRKSEFNDPSNGTYKYEYDGFGQLRKTISPKGTKEYTYNNLGQLISQKELSTTDGGLATNKTISYTYDDKGRLISKAGTSNGNSYNSNITFDPQGRILSSAESGNGKYFIQKGIIYDDKARIISYEKQLYSSGVLTKVNIENVYSPWNGELYQVKDKNSGKILWQLNETNAKGQVLKTRLGAVDIINTYDVNGFLTNVNHSSAVKPGILQLSYSFDAIRNELKSRTTGGDFNITESFDYDDNNRLVNWTNPVTGIKPSANRNIYDDKGRILENDQVGKIKFENPAKVYQATGMTLNAAGIQNYNNDLIQNISYNENNDPVFIDGEKGDAAFQYGLIAMRQKVSYGGNFGNDQEGKFTKYYSEDGSFEIIKDNVSGKEKHILYIGGTPYESNIVYLKNFNEDNGSYKFLHKDYIGSILAISDEAGNKLEQRHFDAWGNFTHLQIGNGAVITDKNVILSETKNLIIDRGYTSHEHFAEIGLIHMNGRLYDPLLRRFLNADENIQDPANTQNYNKYGYVMNNPLMYNDPSGEAFFLAPIVAWIVANAAAIGTGALIGIAISAGMYAVQAIINNSWSWKDFSRSVLLGAITGAVSAGIGQVFSASGFWGTVGVGALSGGVTGGITALITGDNFLQGVLKGAVIGGGVAALSYTLNFYSRPRYSELTKAEYDALGIPDSGEALDPSIHTLRKMYKDTGWSEMKTGAKQFYVDHVSDGYTKRGDLYINAKGEEVIAYTRRNFWNGNTSSLSFSKYAFGSKIKLGFVMNHELGHSVINLSPLNDYLQVKTKSGYEPEMLPKAYGLDKISIEHGAIWGIERDFLKLNGLDKLPGFFDSKNVTYFNTYFLENQQYRRVYDAIKHLPVKLK